MFEGAEVWIDVDEEDLMDIRDTLTTFLFSVVMERLLHSLMEVRKLLLLVHEEGYSVVVRGLSIQ